MNWIGFGVNRLHWSLIRHAGRAIRKAGMVHMTAQRHAVLTMIRNNPGILQHQLQRLRGTVSSTMSRMLKVLERLGVVSRKRAPNGRHRIVNLTDQGVLGLMGANHALNRLEDEDNPTGNPYATSNPYFLELPEDEQPGLWMFAPNPDDWGYVHEIRSRMGRAFGPYRLLHPDDQTSFRY